MNLNTKWLENLRSLVKCQERAIMVNLAWKSRSNHFLPIRLIELETGEFLKVDIRERPRMNSGNYFVVTLFPVIGVNSPFYN